MAEAEAARMSYADDLRFEEASSTKHEYLRGEVYARAGGTPDHAALIAAVTIQLGIVLRDKPCRVYSSDLRVRVDTTDLAQHDLARGARHGGCPVPPGRSPLRAQAVAEAITRIGEDPRLIESTLGNLEQWARELAPS